MTSVADIKEMLARSNLRPSEDGLIASGEITSSSGNRDQYKIFNGWDPVRSNLCDQHWGEFNLNLVEFIAAKNYSSDELPKIVEDVQLEDSHWSWLTKSCIYMGAEYSWFFMDANESTQAACLIYHPRKSETSPGNIFYIEYVAVAPWNRKNPMCERLYSGVGSRIIRCVMEYSVTELSLRYGFNLHSLPKAKTFYEKIGMVPIEAHDKPSLSFYEMTEDAAKIYLGVP